MRALDRLFWAKNDFENAWRAHAVALRSVQLVLELPRANDEALKETLHRTDGLEAGFDRDFALEHLRYEAQQVQDSDYFALRKNCLLGVCASFEDYVKTVAAALSYEPDWKLLEEGKRLRQSTEADFHEKFAVQDKAWRDWLIEKPETYFLPSRFDGLTEFVEECVREVFWFRNQLAHNGDMVGLRGTKTGKKLKVFGQTFFPGDQLQLDSERLRGLTQYLHNIVTSISDGLPYMESRLP